jgi:antitoxin Phd
MQVGTDTCFYARAGFAPNALCRLCGALEVAAQDAVRGQQNPTAVVAVGRRDAPAAARYNLSSLSRNRVSVVVWQLQAAKQHFSELVERARRDGPQVVTKHGKDAVVVVSAEEYRRLRGGGPSLVEFIRSAPDFDALDLDRSQDHGRDVEL